MAAGGQITEFFATLGLKVRQEDIRKFDKTLDVIEKRARKFTETALSDIKVNISGFRFAGDFNTRLYKSLQKKMKMVGDRKGISPEITISKFSVDKTELLAEMKEAARYVERNLRLNLRTGVTHPTGGFTGQRAVAGGVSRFGAGLGLGSAAGGLGRGFIPGLGVAFGISQMNRLNQELIGQDLAASAVFGGPAQGQEQLDWLRNLGNKIGFDYRSQANAYLKMQAAATTAGMDITGGQKIFTSMAEYGRVMGLSDEDMKGSMRAVEQMLNKGQVYAEELKMQLGEKFPAAIQLMAEAVAGGDTEKLFEMMEKGEVRSLEALPRFAEILSRQARVGGALTEAMKTSLAEQMRFNNSFNDMVVLFSKAGFEEGQAGIFKIMRDFMLNMTPLIEGFGEAWQYVGNLLRIPLGLLHDVGVGLSVLSDNTGIAKGKLVAFGTYLGLLALPLTRTVTLITTGLAVLEDFTAFLSGRKSLLGNLLGDDSEATRQNIINLFSTLAETVKTVFDRLVDIKNLLASDIDGGFLGNLNALLVRIETTLDRFNVMIGGESRMARESMNAPSYLRRPEVAETRFDKVRNLAKSLQPSFIPDFVWENMTPLGMLGSGELPGVLGGLLSSSDDNMSPYAQDVYRIGGEAQGYSNIPNQVSIGNINLEVKDVTNAEELMTEFEKKLVETYQDATNQFTQGGQ